MGFGISNYTNLHCPVCGIVIFTSMNGNNLFRYVLDAFSDGLWLLKLCNVDKLTLKSYEQDIVNALRNVC